MAYPCDCFFFCRQGKEHPNNTFHVSFRKITSVLKVAESLDPNDYIYLEACETCGHVREIRSEEDTD